MTIITHTTYEYDGFEFDIEPYEDSIQVKETDDFFTVGYLAQDDSPGVWNDGDGIGDIYFGSRHYINWKKYCDALGLDYDFRHDEEKNINADAVLLSVYEHGGIALSIMGEGTQCQWDTANGGAVWVPDEYLKEELIKLGLEKGLDERNKMTQKYARQAIETWNAYNNGDVWGIIIRQYDKDRNFIEEVENCWGFVGYKYALEELQSEMKIDESESRLEIA